MGPIGLAAQAAVPWGPQEDEEEEWRREVDEKRSKERRKKEYQDRYLESLRAAEGEGAAERLSQPQVGTVRMREGWMDQEPVDPAPLRAVPSLSRWPPGQPVWPVPLGTAHRGAGLGGSQVEGEGQVPWDSWSPRYQGPP